MKKLCFLFVLLLSGSPAYGQIFQSNAPSQLSHSAAASSSEMIFPFNEGYPTDQYYFLQRSPDSDIEVKRSSDAIEGEDASVRVGWEVAVSSSQNGFAGFGYLHRTVSDTIPDLSAYDELSLWHKDLEVPDALQQVRFRFQLHEDSTVTNDDGDKNSETWVYENADVIGNASSWSELRIPLEVKEASGASEDGFFIPSSGFVDNGELDFDRIKHWSIMLVVNEAQAGSSINGETLFDLLTAVENPVPVDEAPSSPATHLLKGNAPNPFATSTAIRYVLGQPAQVTLEVYNMLGQRVATVVDARAQSAGSHTARFDASQLAAGPYVCQLIVDGQRYSHVMTVLRR